VGSARKQEHRECEGHSLSRNVQPESDDPELCFKLMRAEVPIVVRGGLMSEKRARVAEVKRIVDRLVQ